MGVAIPNTDYKTDYNNFIPANATDIDSLFQLYQNEITDYHKPLMTMEQTTIKSVQEN